MKRTAVAIFSSPKSKSQAPWTKWSNFLYTLPMQDWHTNLVICVWWCVCWISKITSQCPHLPSQSAVSEVASLNCSSYPSNCWLNLEVAVTMPYAFVYSALTLHWVLGLTSIPFIDCNGERKIWQKPSARPVLCSKWDKLLNNIFNVSSINHVQIFENNFSGEKIGILSFMQRLS